MSPSSPRAANHELGFLGLGQMGSAIAERLQDAGAQLHLFDPNETTLGPFVAGGAHVHASPTRVADAARIVFACLPSAVSEAVARDVVVGSAVRIYVEMSTIGGPAEARAQAIVEARGITLVAPGARAESVPGCTASERTSSRWVTGLARRS